MDPGDVSVHAQLIRDLIAATERTNAASEAFDSVIKQIPSKTPHPDGVQRIKNASRELTEARAEMMKAHIRLNEFLGRGIGPDDLKLD